jgi:hypothetical protein
MITDRADDFRRFVEDDIRQRRERDTSAGA